nr:2-succinyl-5-enolpyruvyl-6-hydroxy-3-cyclohexene-1-carboxylic-acid synthase [Candidatus Desulfatibia profunda]
AVLVCTSGTAAANYFPAVVEASMDRVPLIMLTADRPPELLGSGANQTIDQVNLYSKYVRYHFELPCPDKQIPPESILTVVDQAVYRTTRSPRGPVHINCMFREPLVPTQSQKDFSLYLLGVKRWINGNKPFTLYGPSIHTIDDSKVEQLAAVINKAQNGLLVIGKLNADSEREAVRRLSQKLNWPTFADIRSGLRLGVKDSNTITYFDQLLLADTFQKLNPSVILHLGGVMVSKRFQFFIQKNQPEHYIHVSDHPFRHDPDHRITARIESDFCWFCLKLLPLIKTGADNLFLKRFQKADNIAGEIVEMFIADSPAITEPAVARIVSKTIPKDSCLFVGNSMPIRDMDMYADPSGPGVKIAANRGASGIDGNIATASGFLHGSRAPGTLVLGDLACLHDVNSLALLANISNPLTVVVVNNNGGGIFSFLPVSECREIFEPFFATPHNLTFEKVAETFRLEYYQPRSKKAFIQDYQKAINTNRSTVIEVRTDRDENLTFHRLLQDKIKTNIDNL